VKRDLQAAQAAFVAGRLSARVHAPAPNAPPAHPRATSHTQTHLHATVEETNDMTNSDSQEQPTSRRRKSATAQTAAGMNGAKATTRASAAQAEPQAENEQPFEVALAQLDEIVATLEDGRLPLDDALALFERGVRLARRCQAHLDTAELRVERLRVESSLGDPDAADATYALEDFDEDDE